MHEIIRKKRLCPDVVLLELREPNIAKKAKPGQFVIVRTNKDGERIPLTISNFNRENGTITLIIKEIGKTTTIMGRLEKGDSLLNVLGPLGKPSEIKHYGTVVCIGGGIGVAAIYPIARSLKSAGNKIISIIGARSREYVILENEIGAVSDELHITTDDGSAGRKGFVTEVLKELIKIREKIDLVIAIGPTVMMKAVSETTKSYGIKTVVSLNPIMVDGTGMSGGCRVTVGSETKFACVDGPEFDGHMVDFESLMLRNKRFEQHECKALKAVTEDAR